LIVKKGHELWVVERPEGLPEHVMLCGADVFHNVGRNKQSVVGFCSTINKNFSKYCSIPHV